jgi:hypothetical protein
MAVGLFFVIVVLVWLQSLHLRWLNARARVAKASPDIVVATDVVVPPPRRPSEVESVPKTRADKIHMRQAQ